jgi:hypothetical protein
MLICRVHPEIDYLVILKKKEQQITIFQLKINNHIQGNIYLRPVQSKYRGEAGRKFTIMV